MAASTFATLDDLQERSLVLARVDLNSPVEEGEVQDNPRFGAHAETVRDLANAGHRVTLLAHQGRPGDADFVSLAQHADILSDHLDQPVQFCPDTAGAAAAAAIDDLDTGEILLLENVRMHTDELADRSPEEHAQCELVRALTGNADTYVGDAYSTAHRTHASIVGIPRAVDHVYAGRVMDAEFTANSAIQSRTFEGPAVMALGGRKVSDLFRVIRGVDGRVDTFLLGGVIGELFLRAAGHEVGYDVGEIELYDDVWAEHGDTIRSLWEQYGDRMELPVDLAYTGERGDRAEAAVDGVEKEAAFLDVGSETIDQFSRVCGEADAVFVKGSLGVFEDERFQDGTVGLLRAIGESDAFSVIGGGDTSRAIDLFDLDPSAYDHVSIAGGAYVRALAGEALPGVEALRPRSHEPAR